MISNSLILVGLNILLSLSDISSWHLIQQLSLLNQISKASDWLMHFLVNNHLVINRLLQELPYVLRLTPSNFFFWLFLGQMVGARGLSYRWLGACGSTSWPILCRLVSVMSRRRVTKRATSRGTLLFVRVLRMLMLLLLLLRLRGSRMLFWRVSHWLRLRQLRHNSLSLRLCRFHPFWVQRVCRFRLRHDFIWKTLSILLVLLPFVVIRNDLSRHRRNMRGTFSVWLLVDGPSGDWAF